LWTSLWPMPKTNWKFIVMETEKGDIMRERVRKEARIEGSKG